MKRFKKTAAFILVGILLLTACTGLDPDTTPDQGATPDSGTQTTTTDTTTTTVTTQDGDGRAMLGNMYLEGLPIVKETESFTMFVDDNGLPEDKIMFPVLEEQTNIRVDLTLLPHQAAVERLNIMLSSGDYPDVIGGWLLNDNSVLQNGMQERIFIPIDQMIEAHSPRMREILEIGGVRQTMTLPDGHIYSIPYVIGEPTVSFNPWINSVWLRDLNLQMPSTTEEFRDVLRAFKDADPAGGGRTIPFSGDPNNLSLGTFAGWWGVDASVAGVNRHFGMVDGRLVFGPAQEGYKEMIKFFAELYAEGLVDPELFTQDLSSWKAKGANGLYGVSMAYGSGDFAEGDRDMFPDYDNERTHYDPLPVLQGNPGVRQLWRRNGYGMTTFRTQVAITDAATNPETIIRWWDNVFEVDNSAQLQWGPFGIRLEKISEFEFRSIPEDTLTEAEKEKYQWGNYFAQALPKYLPSYVSLYQGNVYREKDVADELYEPYLNTPVPRAWVSAEEAERLVIIETDILNYMKQIEAEWVTGQADVESGWEAHLQQLDSLGLQELTRMRQSAIDGN